MYIKDVDINGMSCKYVYYKIGNVEICIGYLDRYNNLVVRFREK